MLFVFLAPLIALVNAGQIKVGEDGGIIGADSIEVVVQEVQEEVKPTLIKISSNVKPQFIRTDKKHGRGQEGHRLAFGHGRGRFGRPLVKFRTVASGAKYDVWRIWGQHRYLVGREAKSFDDAEKRCVKYGGHLASIHSEEENDYIHQLTTTGSNAKSFNDFVYIGLRMNPKTKIWSWTDGTVFNYKKWATHQPDVPEYEHCCQLHEDPGPGLIYVQDKHWNSISCNNPMKYFVCKK